MANVATIRDTMKDLHEINMAGEVISLEIVGPPGCAKTSVVRQWAGERAKEMGLEFGKTFGFKVAHASTEDPLDGPGCIHITEDTEGPFKGIKRAERTWPSVFPQPWEYPDGVVPEYGVLLMDEWGQAEHDQHKAYATLIDEKRMGKYNLPEGWIVILTSNRVSDKSGVQKPLAFVTTRKVVVDMEYNSFYHAEWLAAKGVHHKLTSFVEANPSIVQADSVPDHDNPYCNSRTFFRACLQLQQAGVIDSIGREDDMPPRAKLVREQVIGTVGEAAGTRIFGHLRFCDSMVSIEDIMKNPKTADLPERPDVWWAVVQMIAQHCKEQGQAGASGASLMPIFTYMDRMPENFAISCLRLIAKGNKKMLADTRYVEWVRDHRELIMAAVAAENRARGRA